MPSCPSVAAVSGSSSSSSARGAGGCEEGLSFDQAEEQPPPSPPVSARAAPRPWMRSRARARRRHGERGRHHRAARHGAGRLERGFAFHFFAELRADGPPLALQRRRRLHPRTPWARPSRRPSRTLGRTSANKRTVGDTLVTLLDEQSMELAEALAGRDQGRLGAATLWSGRSLRSLSRTGRGRRQLADSGTARTAHAPRARALRRVDPAVRGRGRAVSTSPGCSTRSRQGPAARARRLRRYLQPGARQDRRPAPNTSGSVRRRRHR